MDTKGAFIQIKTVDAHRSQGPKSKLAGQPLLRVLGLGPLQRAGPGGCLVLQIPYEARLQELLPRE